MLRALFFVFSVIVAGGVIWPAAAVGQTLGAFRWQLQPYCNVLTLTVTQIGGGYRLEGTDDQCGGARAAAIGMAFQQPDGSLGFGLTIVSSPQGSPVHVDATIKMSTLSGTWRDSAGHSGAFVLTPAAGIGGSPRPASQQGGGLSGVSLGFGLTSTTGPGDNVSMQVDVEQVKAGLEMRTPGSNNLAIGLNALKAFDTSVDTGSNTAFGDRALQALTNGGLNTAVGQGAMGSTTTGSANTAVGVDALGLNTTGRDNVAVGDAALYYTTTGSENVAIGNFALSIAQGGSRNVALGNRALPGNKGSDNIAVGHGAGDALSSGSTGTNNIFIGNAGVIGDNNTIRIGKSGHVSTYMAGIVSQTSSNGVPVYINNFGKLGTSTSSIRFKADVAPVEQDARRLHDLNPVRFIYKPEYDDGAGQVQFGLIAEEVEKTFPELVARDEDGRPWTVRYHLLTPLLLADVQRLERERLALTEALSAQTARIDELTREIAALRERTDKK